MVFDSYLIEITQNSEDFSLLQRIWNANVGPTYHSDVSWYCLPLLEACYQSSFHWPLLRTIDQLGLLRIQIQADHQYVWPSIIEWLHSRPHPFDNRVHHFSSCYLRRLKVDHSWLWHDMHYQITWSTKIGHCLACLEEFAELARHRQSCQARQFQPIAFLLVEVEVALVLFHYQVLSAKLEEAWSIVRLWGPIRRCSYAPQSPFYSNHTICSLRWDCGIRIGYSVCKRCSYNVPSTCRCRTGSPPA